MTWLTSVPVANGGLYENPSYTYEFLDLFWATANQET